MPRTYEKMLTYKGNFCDIAACTLPDYCCKQGQFYDGVCDAKAVWEKLRAYEKTGLQPHQVAELAKGAKA